MSKSNANHSCTPRPISCYDPWKVVGNIKFGGGVIFGVNLSQAWLLLLFFFLLELLLISTMTQNFEIYPHNHGQLINRQTEQITFSLWTKHKHDYINTKWRRWGIEKPSPVGAKVTTHHCDSVHLVNKSLCLSSVDTVETRIVQKWLMMMMANMWKYTLSSVWKCLCLSAKQKV